MTAGRLGFVKWEVNAFEAVSRDARFAAIVAHDVDKLFWVVEDDELVDTEVVESEM